MFKMFGQMFNSLTMLFTSLERGAKAIDHLATVAEKHAAAYAAEEDIKIQAKLAALAKEHNVPALTLAK